jgi:hypothetical protein
VAAEGETASAFRSAGLNPWVSANPRMTVVPARDGSSRALLVILRAYSYAAVTGRLRSLGSLRMASRRQGPGSTLSVVAKKGSGVCLLCVCSPRDACVTSKGWASIAELMQQTSSQLELTGGFGGAKDDDRSSRRLDCGTLRLRDAPGDDRHPRSGPSRSASRDGSGAPESGTAAASG